MVPFLGRHGYSQRRKETPPSHFLPQRHTNAIGIKENVNYKQPCRRVKQARKMKESRSQFDLKVRVHCPD